MATHRGTTASLCRLPAQRAKQDPIKSEKIFKSALPIYYRDTVEGYVQAAEITWANTERGRGPMGTAIRTARPYVCQDIASDPYTMRASVIKPATAT